MATNNHYGLEVLVNEHQYELRQNADNYRLAQEASTKNADSGEALWYSGSFVVALRQVSSHLPCLLAYWRYRLLVRVGAAQVAQPCG